MTSPHATIFVVDDDNSVRNALKRLVTSLGFTVETYNSAQAFLEREPHDGPACLILDIRMPGTSGIKLQKKLGEVGNQIPIIFITGHGNIQMSVKAMKAGAVDFLEKPFEDQALVDAIHTAIAKSCEQRQHGLEIQNLQRRVDSLTPREYEVFMLVVSGILNKQIAMELGMSEKTVKVHRGRVMQKMEAASLADLVRMAEKSKIYDVKKQAV